MKYLILTIVLLAGCGAAREGCEHLSRQCNGNMLELCDADGYWFDADECFQDESCCEFADGGAGCVFGGCYE